MKDHLAAIASLPTVEGLSLAAARSAHRLHTYARSGIHGQDLVVIVIVDKREHLLARSTFATTQDPRRVAEHVLGASLLSRCSPYRADSTHRETRIEALVAPDPTRLLSSFERLRATRPVRTA